MKKRTVFGTALGLVTGVGVGVVISEKVISNPKLGGDKKTEKFK